MAKLQEKDSVWTKEKQIERLTKPSSKYLNLNPWEVFNFLLFPFPFLYRPYIITE